MFWTTLFLLADATLANPIVNGEREYEFESAMSLGAEFNGNTFSACSGNLITSRVVLTAAHCGADLPLDLLVDLGRAFFGDDIEEAEHTMEFEDLVVHPEYEPLQSGTGNLGQYDVSVLVLSEDAPIRPTPIRLDLWNNEELPADVVSVGFGTTDAASGRGSGKKRSAALTIDDFDRMFLYSSSDTNLNEAQICSGDSGGPQFQWVDDRWQQVAVHSWGDQDCLVSSGSTRVDKVQEWIFDQIEDVHGTRDWCEAAGVYDDGSCDDFCDEIDPDCVVDTGGDGERTGLGCGCSQSSTDPMHPAGWVLALLGLVQQRRRKEATV